MKFKLSTLPFLFFMAILSNLNAEVTYTHTDALGSVVAESDAYGEVVTRYHYRPYGKTDTPQDDSPGYTGHVFDDDLGLSYMKARYYDPEIGRFYSNDPAGFSTGNPFSFNRYAYANNNPYKFVDPDGRDAIKITYVGYLVNTEVKIPFTNTEIHIPAYHSAVISVNPETGKTRYYEYGRYDKENFGVVERRTIPDLVMEKGKPTQASLDNLYETIKEERGKGFPIWDTYYDDADYKKVNAYAEKVKRDENREKYSFIDNRCDIFAEKAIDEGRK